MDRGPVYGSKRYSKTGAAVLSVLLPVLLFVSSAFAAPLAEPSDTAEKKDWTVMIYMIGSNLESNYAAATLDLLELERAGIDYEKSNVLIGTGGTNRWFSDIPSDRNCILDMSEKKEQRIVSVSEESRDMGEAQTFADFINYCHENYPAEHTMLICWDHGGGPIAGYGYDELFEGDALLLSEMTEAMEMTPYADRESLDIVGFDACLMGSLESMAVWSDYAELYLASEEVEPGAGWNYEALSVMNSGPEPEELAEAVVDGFGYYYENKSSYLPEVTLSVTDLSKTDEVIACLDSLAEAISGNLGEIEFAALLRDRDRTRTFGKSAAGEEYSYDLADLSDLAGKLSETWPDECTALRTAVDRMVRQQYSTMENTCGISVYFPSANKTQFRSKYYTYKKISRAKSYNALLEEIGRSWKKTRTRNWILADPYRKKDEILLELSRNQEEHMIRASYSVFTKGDDGYVVLTSGNEIDSDEDGILHVPADPYIICFGDEQNYIPGYQMKQVYSGYNMQVYEPDRFSITDNLFAVHEYGISLPSYLERISPGIMLDDTSGGTEMVSLSAYQTGTGEPFGKSQVDLEGAEAIYYITGHSIPLKDENGKVLPYQEWKDTHIYGVCFMGIDGEIRTFSKKASEIRDTYIQIQIEDANGDCYASDLVKIQTGDKYEVMEQKTEKGMLTFYVYKDHAELAGYEGKDEELVLPEQAGNVPLTVIGNDVFGSRDLLSGRSDYRIRTIELPDSIQQIGARAFMNCYDLEEIVLPKDLKSIGESAFAYCSSLVRLQIPKGVAEIGKCAFAFCSGLKQLALASSLEKTGRGLVMGSTSLEEMIIPDSGKYEVSEGMLYDKENEEVLCFAAGSPAEDPVVIREGTKNIAYGAFYGAQGRTVVFPDSLETIGNFAFYNCRGLKVEKWPEKLQKVGERGFGASSYIFSDEEDEEITKAVEIGIGAELSYLGKGAFDIFRVKSFAADENNPIFSVREGNLMNKAGDAVSQFATNMETVVNVPEGTVSLGWNELMFAESYYGGIIGNETVTIRIPDSVVRFPESSWPGFAKIVFDCGKGSAAEKYAKENGIAITGEALSDAGEQYEVKRIETGEDICWYHIYQDHAELAGLLSSREKFEIPDRIEGLPVTAVGNGSDAVHRYPASSYEERNSFGFPEEIEIPRSVKRIQDYAFSSCSSLKRITFREGLTSIGRFAFYGVIFEEDVALPESLKSLASYAFGKSKYTDVPEEKMYSLYIGKNLDDISAYAFKDSHIKGISVSEDNRYYASADGLLTDKKKREFYYCPYGKKGELRLPASVSSIEACAFDANCGVTDLYLSDSVVFISSVAFDSTLYERIVIHAPAGSEAAAFAYDRDMQFVAEESRDDKS